MGSREHETTRIMKAARSICGEDGGDVLTRHLIKLRTGQYALEIEAPKPPQILDGDWSAHVAQLNSKLIAIEGVAKVILLVAERVGEAVRIPSRLTQKNKTELARIYEEAERICRMNGGGAEINSVVPENDGYLVDINFWPLEAIDDHTRTLIIEAVETRIKSIPGVKSLAHMGVE